MANKLSMQKWSDQLTLLLKEDVGISILQLLTVAKSDALLSFYNDGFSPVQTTLIIATALRTGTEKDVPIEEPKSYQWFHEMYLQTQS